MENRVIDTSLRERRESIVRKHINAENLHDVDGVIASFHYPRYDVAPLGEVNDGEVAVRNLITDLITGFPDFHFEPLVFHHADNAVVVEGKMTGTHMGSWVRLAPTGHSIDVRAICVFEFENDRLMCEKVYFDFATIMRQLRVI
jgi:steroid delta-isomerase-like uncharacterized protein